MKKHWTKDVLEEVVRLSGSYKEVFDRLNLVRSGASYNILKKYIKEYNLDIEHFVTKATIARPLQDYLDNKAPIASFQLKRKLLKNSLLEYKCSWCDITEWRGQKISLELDHIDGNRNNNNLSNLRILCPNCHSQTPTNKGRNKNKYNGCPQKVKTKTARVLKPDKYCLGCNKKVSKKSDRCKSCSRKFFNPKKIMWPPIEQLIEELKTTPFTTLAKKLGVSDNAIRKHLKNYDN